MRKPLAITYQPRWADDGTVYRQTVNVPINQMSFLKSVLKAEIKNPTSPDDYYRNLYLKSPLGGEGKIVFTNLTQRDFFNEFLKLKLLDRNTCFYIID